MDRLLILAVLQKASPTTPELEHVNFPKPFCETELSERASGRAGKGNSDTSVRNRHAHPRTPAAR